MTDQDSSQDKEAVIDNLGDEQFVPTIKYSISSYGADYDVYGLVRRMNEGDIFVPSFQRAFIWSPKQASRFIESLLLGLPVPAIFLSRDEDSKKYLIIDGQQRLSSLRYFYKGEFPETHKVFALEGVQKQFEGKTYESLSPEDRRQLDNSILHATIIRQDEPAYDNTSVYYIFERLNTTGTPLTSQEIRASIYGGELNNLLEELNENSAWRAIYGPINKRRRDQEFILRFFALYFYSQIYNPPMKEFLNKYMSGNRHLTLQPGDLLTHLFTQTIETIYKYIGSKAFRLVKAFNAAIFDAVMVGVARRLEKGKITNGLTFRSSYESLLKSKIFLAAIETGTTASSSSVTARITEATKAFQNVE